MSVDREAFEAWIKKNYFNATEALAKQDNGNYYFHEASEKWTVWQAALASQQQDHIGDSTKLVQAVNALAEQTGESPESITKWLCDKGGLAQLMLSHFGGMQSQAKQKCSCVRATSRNTPAVKAGYEMGGYVKNVCTYCQSQAQQTENHKAKIKAWCNTLEKAADNFERHGYSGESADLLDIKAYIQPLPAPEGGDK